MDPNWNQTRRDLGRAEIVRRNVDRNGLDRLFRTQLLRIPAKVWIEDDVGSLGTSLCWLASLDPPEYVDAVDPLPPIEPGQVLTDTGILERFARLEAAAPAKFVSFAKTYGPLELCKHHLPLGHHPDDAPDRGPCGWLVHPRDSRASFTPLSSWRVYAGAVHASLAIAAQLHRKKSGGRDAWLRIMHGVSTRFSQDVFPTDNRKVGLSWIGRVGPEKRFLGMVVDHWLDLGGVRPVFRWVGERDGPVIDLEGGGVFGAVMKHLAFSIARVDGFEVCAGCGAAFIPRRRPAPGRDSWCGADECMKASDRARQRRRRARIAQEEEADDAQEA